MVSTQKEYSIDIVKYNQFREKFSESADFIQSSGCPVCIGRTDIWHYKDSTIAVKVENGLRSDSELLLKLSAFGYEKGNNIVQILSEVETMLK